MSSGALWLALASAGVHALWNLLLAGARDTVAAMAAQLVVSLVAWAPVAALTWHLDAAALPYLLPASACQLAYFALLAAAYEAGEMSLVYPL
ncbi:MAG: EamA family transporter, partial [Solirubrobacteraceae bacterium]|nr:EamA family transporter [Solirubrobacteraceae bacterium]